MKALKRWMNRATADDKRDAAAKAGTSVNHLGQLASGHRKAGPALARSIEIAVGPSVPRESLCAACAKCEFAKRARS